MIQLHGWIIHNEEIKPIDNANMWFCWCLTLRRWHLPRKNKQAWTLQSGVRGVRWTLESIMGLIASDFHNHSNIFSVSVWNQWHFQHYDTVKLTILILPQDSYVRSLGCSQLLSKLKWHVHYSFPEFQNVAVSQSCDCATFFFFAQNLEICMRRLKIVAF